VTPATPAVLEVAGVSKNYHALRPLRIQRLDVRAGQLIAILGLDQPSAEVFVNLVTGAALPDTGDVSVFGRSTSAIGDSADWLALVDRLGIVSHRAVLLDQLTVTQNLSIPFTLDIEPPADDVRQRADALAREVGLPEFAWTKPIAEFDAASRARVRLARALALDPAMLLLEHLSAGLTRDEATRLGADIRQIAMRRGAAVLAATGDEYFARAVATRVLTLDAASGRLTERRRFGWFQR
jgi:ABC-type transporter Mla maintaining outer membrane lipid asymmetry ATPase subunit MlaF